MSITSRLLGEAPLLKIKTPNQEKRIRDRENSTLIKIAACIPFIGLFVNQIESKSLQEKFKALPLPKSLRPHPILGNVLDENVSPEIIKVVCTRAVELKSIERDYTKAALVNNLITVALAVSALAMNVISFIIGAILIGGFSLTTAVLAFVLCTDHSIKRYEKEITANT